MTEDSPVTAEELVLRRVHRNNFEPDLPVPVQRCEFEPKPKDTDGASFYREIFVPAETVANSGRSPGNYYVSRVRVADLNALGLNVVPSAAAPGDDLPGHVCVPELSYAAFTRDKQKSKELQRSLAILASRSIVWQPT